MLDGDLMGVALAEAADGVQTGNGEVGVAVALDGELVYSGHNRINSTHDITGHAEIDALRAVSRVLGTPFLEGYDLFCTLEPCGMCVCACSWARIRRIVFGARKASTPSRYFELDTSVDAAWLARHSSWRPEIVSGLRAAECERLYL